MTTTRRKSSGERGAELREQILDVAEALFADRGFYGVSIREITDAAGTRLAAVNYHFGSKDSLFGQVIRRRASWLNEQRIERLQSSVNVPALESHLKHLVRAFYTPLLDQFLTGSEGWRNYCRLISQVAVVHLWMDSYIAPIFNETSLVFIERLKELSPGVDERRAAGAFQFMVSTVLYVFADNHRLETLTGSRLHSADVETLASDLEIFCVGGIVRLLGYESCSNA